MTNRVPVRVRKPDYKCFAVASWIVVYKLDHGGCSPTVEEIATHFGVNKSVIQVHLMRLEEFGMARRKDGKLVLSEESYIPPPWYISALDSHPE